METLKGFLADEKERSPQGIDDGVGYLSIHVPEEIVIAAGKVPFRIFGIGGQDSKAIAIVGLDNGSARVVDFIMNDKCAAGTGRFLEVMAGVLDVDVRDLGRLSQKSSKEVSISSMCTVFAESEVISLIHQKLPKEDIISGLHTAIARKVLSLVQRVPIKEEITLTGGVMKNIGVCEKLRQELLPKRSNLPDEPQIVGALGAAIMARKYAHSSTS